MACSTYGGKGEVHTGIWLGNLIERDNLDRPRYRWEDNIKMDFQEVGCGGMDWIDLLQDRVKWQAVVTAVMNLRDP